MKYLLIFIVLFASCKQKVFYEPKVVHDTIVVEVNKCDSVSSLLALKTDSLRVVRDSLLARTNRLKTANFKVTKAKYYLSILDKNPAYVKYIKGWLNNRALAD
jgi:hypothetical protein